MAYTYNTIGTFTSGQILNAAQMNEIGQNSNNYRTPPRALAQFTANQTVNNNVNTKLALNSATFSTECTVTSGAAGKITVTNAGVYLVSYQLIFNGVNGTGSRYFTVTKNTETGADNLGGQLPMSDTPAAGAFWRSVSASRLIQLAAGDYLSLEMYQTSGTNMTNVAAYPSWFSVSWQGVAP